MDDHLKKELDDIESRGHYLEMGDVLKTNLFLLKNDADFAIYFLKCIVGGGLVDGNNDSVVQALERSGGDKTSKNMLERMSAKLCNNVTDIGKSSVIALTNSYFILSIQTAITYGNSDIIDQAAKIICPLYNSIGEMLKHKATISNITFNLVAGLMCMLGNTIADSVAKTNKANLPGSKNIIGGFVESIMVPLKAFCSGFAGLFLGASSDIKKRVRETYNRMSSMA